MPVANYYIPYTGHWNRRLVSEDFVRLQLSRARESYRQAMSALDSLDEDVKNIEREIKSQWAEANVQVMRGFLARLKEVAKERKRLNYVLLKLRVAINDMFAIAKERGWNL